MEMNVQHNIELKGKTTFRVGGVAKNFWMPQSTNELIECLNHIEESYYIISGGSNLLINDNRVFQNVISMESVDRKKEHLGKGKFYIGASNKIQEVITFVNSEGYGGFEELIGLPALFGGIIYMNAGIGRKNQERFNISNYINQVKVVDRDTLTIKWIQKKDCNFYYRNSLFQNNKFIILGAEIELKKQDMNISEKRIEDRRTYIKENQEFGKGCFGSCFCQYNGKLLKFVSIISPWKKNVRQLATNSNWFINQGNCTFKQVKALIDLCIMVHKITFQKNELEVKIWE